MMTYQITQHNRCLGGISYSRRF